MALTINNFWGAETGGLEEINSVSNARSIATQQHSGAYSYEVDSNGSFNIVPFGVIASAGTKTGIGFWIRTPDEVQGWVMLRWYDGTNYDLRLRKDAAGIVYLQDSTLVDRITSTDKLTGINTWYFIEAYFDRVDSGDAELFINGATQGTTSARDFNAVTGTLVIEFFRQSTLSATYFDDIYVMTDLASSADLLGGCEVVPYRSSLASAVADFAGPGSSSLNTGQWADVQEIPFGETNVAAYTDTAARAGGVDTDDVGGSAGTGGPDTDDNIDGDIVAMKGVWRMMRTGGSGATHFGLLGNTGTAIATSDRSADLDPTTGYLNYFDVREDNLPLSTEYLRIGFEKDNKGQDFNCSDMLGQILHVPAVVTPFPYHIFKRRERNMNALQSM